MEKRDIISVAVDYMRGTVAGNYSKRDVSDSLRQALVDLNEGSTKLNIKKFHRGNELYEVVEELITTIIDEGLKNDNPIFNLVEYKNIADGDVNEFHTTGENVFVVANAAAGVLGVRRQRISGGEVVTIKTNTKIARVYENLGRLLAGRIDFDDFITGIAKSFDRQILEDAYMALKNVTAQSIGLSSDYVITGSYSEDELIKLVEHVEAATGKTAKIYGTKAALRKVTTATVSDSAKEDMYNMGYYGKVAGTEMVCLKQAHKADGSTFVLADNQLYIIAGDDKPIKVVREGDGILIEKQATENNDLTQEYVYGENVGTGVIFAEKLGIYTIN